MGDGDLRDSVGFDPYDPGRASMKGDGRPPMPLAIKLAIFWYALLGVGVSIGCYLTHHPLETKAQITTWVVSLVAAPIGAGLAATALAHGLRVSWYFSAPVFLSGIWFSLQLRNAIWPDGPEILRDVLWGYGGTFAVLAPLYFLPLATRAARGFLGRLCPQCGSHKIEHADFWLNNYRCTKCKTVWPARTWLWALKRR